jgi:hypothetical protein
MSAIIQRLRLLAGAALVASTSVVALSGAPAHAAGVTGCAVTSSGGCTSGPVTGAGTSSLEVTASAKCSAPFKVVRLQAATPDYVGEVPAGQTFIASPSFLYGTYHLIIHDSCAGSSGELALP